MRADLKAGAHLAELGSTLEQGDLSTLLGKGQGVGLGQGPGAPGKSFEPGTSVPPGFTRGNKTGWGEGTTPPGWEKGNKTGWGENTTPPGWNNPNGLKSGWNKKQEEEGGEPTGETTAPAGLPLK